MILSGEGGDFEKPEATLQNAVCAAIYDLKWQVTNFGPKHRVLIVWELEQRMTQGDYAGKRFIKANEYTASIHPKSNLGQHLIGWRGRAFTAEELKGFEIEDIVGKPCRLNLIENGDYINIDSILKADPAHALTVEGDYSTPMKWSQDKIDKGTKGPATTGIVSSQDGWTNDTMDTAPDDRDIPF